MQLKGDFAKKAGSTIFFLVMLFLFMKFNPFFGSEGAVRYNDKLVKQQNIVIKKMLSLNKAVETRKIDVMNTKLKALQEQITQSADAVS